MPLIRSSDQSGTLEAFYTDLAQQGTDFYRNIASNMLAMVKLINDAFAETVLWGLTSHARLVIQNQDDWKAEWYIIISNAGTNGYYLEYLMPAGKGPWPSARVHGVAPGLAEALKYLCIAMTECGGWPGNAELRQLTEQHGGVS